MEFEAISYDHPLWEKVRDFAAGCSWNAGKALARMMDEGYFTDWERIVTAVEGDRVCGFCTVTKVDCLPDSPYAPWIGFVFVDEGFRGNRVSQRMIGFAEEYLRKVGFETVYLVSDHENLYEKYGHQVLERVTAPWGAVEKVYRKRLTNG